MIRRVHRSLLSLLLVASHTFASLPAFAQSDEQRAAARDLATEGADAFDAGRYQDAIDRFTRAESLVHAVPHLLFLARSHAKLKQYVKAREAYLKILNEVLPPNASQAARNAKTEASSEISAVESKIARLTIQIEGKESAKELVVTVNGAPVPPVLVGAPQPVDPGELTVAAAASGLRAEPQSVTLGEGERKEVLLKLVADASAPAVVAAPAPVASTTPSDSEPRDEGASGGANGLRIGSYVAFGVGAVGLGVGTVFLLQSSSKRSEADDLCTLPGGACDKENEDKVNALDADADSAGAIGVAGLIVGGIGVATGVTLFVLSSGSSSSAGASAGSKKALGSGPHRPTVAPWFGRNTLGVKGTF
ncbi:MAG TPA: hypothetical protein VFZ53_25690 [Polyangiaceae bacterium]